MNLPIYSNRKAGFHAAGWVGEKKKTSNKSSIPITLEKNLNSLKGHIMKLWANSVAPKSFQKIYGLYDTKEKR